MDTKALLYGIIGFILGGLLVSVAATTFDKSAAKTTGNSSMNTMPATTASHKKTGK